MFVSQWSAHKDKAVCVAAGEMHLLAPFTHDYLLIGLAPSAWSIALRDRRRRWLRQDLE
jgi:hypothetical protein